MGPDFKSPFPFCSDCATWHAPGEHMPRWNPYRTTFWYGWLWGASAGLFVGLIVALCVYAK